VKIIEYMMPIKTHFSMSFHTHVVHHGYHLIISETKPFKIQHDSYEDLQIVSQETVTFLADENWQVIDYTDICRGRDTADVITRLDYYTSDVIKGYGKSPQ